ncbi:hypothetical protein PGT21_006129 [Puccinia graminis f. sp. tritici]|uniref:Uncharacterized protein n=1 Tax=Puccinia graminis f. sp. tritici TaxID=56615 RepID=A0A5B0QEJ4_PUCGR|nr:hypothetical protein PGT21_006129 [Puccinia graminis f. sp. tritici]KAA1123867.1 hypothetical protein PGTUg99_027423 [Puccinia graminis f. sp. tritici]
MQFFLFLFGLLLSQVVIGAPPHHKTFISNEEDTGDSDFNGNFSGGCYDAIGCT